MIVLPSQTMTIPFIYFLRPPFEYELMLPSFQDIWNSLPFVACRSVESDASAVQAVQNWIAFTSIRNNQRDLGPETSGDIIRLMASAPLYTNDLLAHDRHILSIRERARVTNRVRSVPYVSGKFFSEAWLFHTWSDDIVAATLTGTAIAQGLWRGRIEFRCNNGQTYGKYIRMEETSRHFTCFLTNGIFKQQNDPTKDIFGPDYKDEGGGMALGATFAVVSRWQSIQASRKVLGLSIESASSTN